MRILIVISILLVVISCAEPAGKEVQSHDSSTVLEESIKQDSLIEDTTWAWYDEYATQFEQVSYEAIEDSFLKKALEIYFVMDDEKEFTEYRCKQENDNGNVEHAKDYTIRVKLSAFDSTKHTITRTKNGSVYLIDDKIFWGTDGGLPASQIDAVNVAYKGEPIPFSKSEYGDLFSPFTDDCQPEKLHLIDGVNSYIVFIAYCSDGAGSYTVAWIFKDGKYIRRVVDSSC